MNPLLRSALAVLALAVASSCSGDDPPPLFMDVQWQVQCDIDGGCTDFPMRDVLGGDGQAGIGLSCSVSPSSGGRNLNFSVAGRDEAGRAFGLRIENAIFPEGGGPLVGTSCELVLTEGGNTYRGGCGSAAPAGPCLVRPEDRSSACTQPCRVFDLETSVDDAGVPQITGMVYCQGIVLQADQLRSVELTNAEAAPAGMRKGVNASMYPIAFTIEACAGL